MRCAVIGIRESSGTGDSQRTAAVATADAIQRKRAAVEGNIPEGADVLGGLARHRT